MIYKPIKTILDVNGVIMINRLILLIILGLFLVTDILFAQNNFYPQEVKLMTYLSSLSYDEEMKPILHPFYVYVDKYRDQIYVIDSAKEGKITIYDKNLFPLFTLDKRWGFTAPICVVTDKKGNIYVLNSKIGGNYEVIKLNRAFLVEKIYPIPEEYMALKIAADEFENVYIVLRSKIGENGHKVVVLNKEGKQVREITPVENGKAVPINEIKIDRKGRIFLISLYYGKIYVLDKDYNLLFKFGEKGGVTGKLSNPKGIGIDEERDIAYIVDYMRHVVNVYSLKEGGKYLFEFGGYGIKVEGWFAFPSSVDVDRKGRVYVADTFNSRIQILSPYEGSVDIRVPKNRVVKQPKKKSDFSVTLVPNFIESFSF